MMAAVQERNKNRKRADICEPDTRHRGGLTRESTANLFDTPPCPRRLPSVVTLLELRENLAFPFLGLLIAAGIFLTIRFRFFQFRYILLSVKILSGALDWKGSRGKLAPFQAFAAGSASALVPGAALGTFIAVTLAGPGILPWIWLSAIPAAAIQFASATLSVRFRKKLADGRILCGASVYTETGLRANWLALLHAGLFLFVALAFGASLPAVMGTAALGAAGFSVPPITLVVVLAIILSLILIGGVRRIGWASGTLVGVGGILALVAFFMFISGSPSGTGLLPPLFQAPTTGFSGIILALAVFHVLTEIGSGKVAAIAGTVRTDFPAKQGVANVVPVFIQCVIVSTLTVIVMHKSGAAGPMSIFQHGPSNMGMWISLGALGCFLVAGIAGWSFAGYQAAVFAGGRVLAIAFEILFLGTLLAAGAFLRIDNRAPDLILLVTTAAGMFTSLFPILASLLLGRTGAVELRRYLDDRYVRYEVSKDIYLLIMHVLPKNLISRVFGWISEIPLPRFIRVPVLLAFAKFYKINLGEADRDLAEYPSLNKFFTRALKEGVRVIDTSKTAVVSPVDATISQSGDVVEGRMIQAKGIDYTIGDLLENSPHTPRFQNGKYMVLYLSPQDYHRIHSPYSGRIVGYTYSPGALFMVNNIAVNGLAGLFPKNERLTSYLETENGMIAVVKVGATNVGKIVVTYDSVRTNRWIRRAQHHAYPSGIPIEKGQELGRFEMGSTVILVFEKDTVELDPKIGEHRKVKFGEIVARFVKRR